MELDDLFNKMSIDYAKYRQVSSNEEIVLDLFSNKKAFYLNELLLYSYYYRSIPNYVIETGINCMEAVLLFLITYQKEIYDCYYAKCNYDAFLKPEVADIFYFLFEDLIVYFQMESGIVKFLYRQTKVELVNEIIALIQTQKKQKVPDKPEISLLIYHDCSHEFKPLQVKPSINSIQENYNDDFDEVHQLILQRLNNKQDKGLVLLHGSPGTGKTSYIKFLITAIDKEVVFLPQSMISTIINPKLIGIFMSKPNTVFVIEDAESIILDRGEQVNSPVNVLLNITDGLLADCLNVQFICTFNTDISKIDSALLRKGRLIAQYQFKELETNKAQQLSDKLGFNTKINKPMLLADIYHQNGIYHTTT
ncbi:MAG: ATP-binding protein [Chitinophagaceae bacterium]|nr:ATP-binding protein [Chitinophagaceae bacterium]